MKDDFSALEKMIYSGRGITIGMTPSGNPFIGYSLTGRSESSQARKLVQGEKTGVIRTEVTKREVLEKGSPALLLYPAIAPVFGISGRPVAMVSSNGAQTKLIYSTAMNVLQNLGWWDAIHILKKAFEKPFYEYDEKVDQWIDLTTYEPDAPNYTPRINAWLSIAPDIRASMHIVKRSKDGDKLSSTKEIELRCGKGKVMTTYKGGNESPLEPSGIEPLNVGIESESPNGIAESLYNAIRGGVNPEDNYRISVAVMMWDRAGVITPPFALRTEIINRYDMGE